jgi:hypothetical protein
MTEDAMVILRRAVREENWELAAMATLVKIAETIRDSGPEAAEALVDELVWEINGPHPHRRRRRRDRR